MSLKTPLASSDFSLKLLEDNRIGQLTDEQKNLKQQKKNKNQHQKIKIKIITVPEPEQLFLPKQIQTPKKKKKNITFFFFSSLPANHLNYKLNFSFFLVCASFCKVFIRAFYIFDF